MMNTGVNIPLIKKEKGNYFPFSFFLRLRSVDYFTLKTPHMNEPFLG